KFWQEWQNVIDSKGQAEADLEHAGRFAAVRRDARNRRLQLLQIVPDRVQETLAGFSQSELACAAVKQPDAEVSLQHRDIAAHGRRGERQPPRCRREAARFGASDEGFEVRESLHRPYFQVMLV